MRSEGRSFERQRRLELTPLFGSVHAENSSRVHLHSRRALSITDAIILTHHPKPFCDSLCSSQQNLHLINDHLVEIPGKLTLFFIVVLGIYRGYRLRQRTKEMAYERELSITSFGESEEDDVVGDSNSDDDVVIKTAPFILNFLYVPSLLFLAASIPYMVNPIPQQAIPIRLVAPLAILCFAMVIFYSRELTRRIHAHFFLVAFLSFAFLVIGDLEAGRVWMMLLVIFVAIPSTTMMHLFFCRVHKNALELLTPAEINKALLGCCWPFVKASLLMMFFGFNKGLRCLDEHWEEQEVCNRLTFANGILMMLILFTVLGIAVQAVFPGSLRSRFTFTFESMATFSLDFVDGLQVFFALIAAVTGLWIFVTVTDDPNMPIPYYFGGFLSLFSCFLAFVMECHKAFRAFRAKREERASVANNEKSNAGQVEEAGRVLVKEMSWAYFALASSFVLAYFLSIASRNHSRQIVQGYFAHCPIFHSRLLEYPSLHEMQAPRLPV